MDKWRNARSLTISLAEDGRGPAYHLSPQHLHQCATHAAWMEDHRREDNGSLTYRAFGLALAHPVSGNGRGIGNLLNGSLREAMQGGRGDD